MSIESEIAALTLATTNLLAAVNAKKSELDQRVAQAAQSAAAAAASAAAVGTPSANLPAMNGTASAGSSSAVSRGDHVHPSDTSRASQAALESLADLVDTKVSLMVFEDFMAELAAKTQVYQLAMSDLSTEITAGANKAYFRVPKAGTLAGVRLSLFGASTSGAVTVDLLKNGASVLSTKPSVLATHRSSTTSGITPVFSDSEVDEDDEITLSVLDSGSGATGLIATVYMVH
ncbi:MAG: hypothetical protein Q7J58_17700 [Hydrogenophaga sp.]|uniref:hypothetical protein n=1 Tax=Hydrogenophaga sp. TaxID=1904254 RepID=UPI00271C0268|nr:hypothetical protein [Hydrogenophaga sp.]MDO9571188.1 hypothetical protein [Hydrogenophaga sp.]MDP3375952.1 hypothetical protein [Hydrogenophaga sp.]